LTRRFDAARAAARPCPNPADSSEAGPVPELSHGLSTWTLRDWHTSLAGQPTSLTQTRTSLAPGTKGAAEVSSANDCAALRGHGTKRRAALPGTMSQDCSREPASEPFTDTRQRHTPPPTSLAEAARSWTPRFGPGSKMLPDSDRTGLTESRKVNHRLLTCAWALPVRPQSPPATP
jgi:hypothetical protein